MIDNTSSIESANIVNQNSVSVEQANQISKNSATVKVENTQPEQVVSPSDQVADTNSEQQTIAPEQLTKIVENLNAFVQLTKRNVSFTIDQESGRDVISVFDAETQELIRQIPSEEALALLKRMDEAVGLLFSERV